MNIFKKIIYFLVVVAIFFGVFVSGFYVGKNQVVCQAVKPETINFSLFWDAYGKLLGKFMSPEKIIEEKILYGAISGMTKSLGDPYTDFFDPEHAKTFQQNLEGSFGGIGIEIAIKKGQLTVVAPLKGTPGEKAGLKSGDLIVAIDGKNTTDMSTEEAVTLIRGTKGTEVTLTIFHDGWNKTKDIKIVRDTIKVDSLTWELKEKNIAYIKINQFDQNLSADFRKIAFEILKTPVNKIVLDLRNNPGGYLEVSQDIAGWFLESGQIVTIEDFGKSKTKQLYKANGNSSFKNYPIVILINGGSASASEILAGALRDNRNVQLIGEKSFGKGSVQEVVALQDGVSFLKVTIAKWLTPKGNSISEVGLAPDVKVEISDTDFTNKKDPQLDKALEIIRDLK